jgi:hypothetical protein
MTVISGAPASHLLGIEDRSIRTPLPEGEALPMHLPLMCLRTQRGPEETQLVGGADMTRLFGVDSFDARKAYANHATIMANTINARGNVMMIKRLVADDAMKANIRLCLEIVPAELTVWDRNMDGSYALDANGDRIDSGNTVSGYKSRWVQKTIADGDFGQGAQMAGDLAGADGEVSQVYPIFDLEVSHHGAYGNNIGLALSCPTVNSPQPVNEDVVSNNQTSLYRLQFVERPDMQSSGRVIKSLFGEQFIEFSFEEGIVNRALSKDISYDMLMPGSYQDVDTKGFAPIYGPMDNTHVYKDKLDEVLGLLTSAEAAADSGHAAVSAMYNPIENANMHGVPYMANELVGPAEGGLVLGDGFYHYANGGSDGTFGDAEFDKAVGDFYSNFENGDEDYMDDAAFPFSAIWDSGFSIATKKKMLTPIGLRKDLYVVLGTQDVMEPQNSASDEQSVAIALRSAARLYPESTHYGTSTCRALIVGHSGVLLNSEYKKMLPLTIDFANKAAGYMGASAGAMKEQESMDASPTNQVSMFRTSSVNAVYKSPRVRQADWTAGLVWVQRFDRQDLFYPAYQTVYDNDTSVLNSAMNMFIAVELEKVAIRTWRELVGNTKLTKAQFVEQSNKKIERKTRNRFDGRVVIKPDTYYTEADNLRGYSWTCDIHMYANNMPTVGVFTITANRMDDLA